MDVRVVETVATAGSLSDSAFRIDALSENVTLDYDYTEKDLALIDTNLNYSSLPWQLGTDLVKKTFLTYNGISCETGELIQTVMMESDSSPEATQLPGYNNSNEWIYKPSEFQIPGDLPTMSDPLDTQYWPYDQSQGITVVKQFLGGESGLVPNRYTAYYRAPTQTSFLMANVEGTKVFTDGWYTSYVIACKTWDAAGADLSAATGQIIYYPSQEKFYVNTTGATGAPITDPNDALLTIPDLTNWVEGPTFVNWMDFLRNNLGPAMTSDPVYFSEHQHLVTADLSAAIRAELLKMGCNCDKDQFNMASVDMWCKLTQKKIGAFIKFNAGVFKSAQQIIETTRESCYLCLYHKNGKAC